MADDRPPSYLPNQPTRPARQPQPVELLLEFHVETTHRFFRCELRDHGEGGIEAQILEAPDKLRVSHRFTDAHTDGALLSAREQAIQWARLVRGDLERKRYDP
jgi:hypothetical protein